MGLPHPDSLAAYPVQTGANFAPRPRMMQRGLGLGCREKFEVLLCTIHARAPVCGSVAPAWSCMRIRVHPSRRVTRGASGGAGGCAARGRAAGDRHCDCKVSRPACWARARASRSRFGAALAEWHPRVLLLLLLLLLLMRDATPNSVRLPTFL